MRFISLSFGEHVLIHVYTGPHKVSGVDLLNTRMNAKYQRTLKLNFI